MEATTKTEREVKDMADIISEAIIMVKNDWPYTIDNNLVQKFIEYVNKFHPELKIDAQINYEPGKTKLSKR